ncbi:MAG: hypothetical protein ACT4N2_13060 [Hyphomicrobium sp.]
MVGSACSHSSETAVDPVSTKSETTAARDSHAIADFSQCLPLQPHIDLDTTRS